MKAKTTVALGGVIAVLAVAYFVPIYYVPAVSPSDCNLSCALGGHGSYYVSISYKFLETGAWYWPTHPQGTYELINTPFGSFG